MTGRVIQISKTHIVYWFYDEDRDNTETDKFFRQHKISKVPTILVFKGGKVVSRYAGIHDVDTVLRGVKTKKSQKDVQYPNWMKLW